MDIIYDNKDNIVSLNIAFIPSHSSLVLLLTLGLYKHHKLALEIMQLILVATLPQRE